MTVLRILSMLQDKCQELTDVFGNEYAHGRQAVLKKRLCVHTIPDGHEVVVTTCGKLRTIGPPLKATDLGRV